LKEVGDLVGIPLLDHIVVGHDLQSNSMTCNSMQSKGLMGAALKGDYFSLAGKGKK
jgi:hypothetical protein